MRRRQSQRNRFWWEVLWGLTAVMLASRPDRWLKRWLWRAWPYVRPHLWPKVSPTGREYRRAYKAWREEGRYTAEAHRAAAEGMEWLKKRQREEMLLSNDYTLTAEQEVERALILIERLRKRIERM